MIDPHTSDPESGSVSDPPPTASGGNPPARMEFEANNSTDLKVGLEEKVSQVLKLLGTVNDPEETVTKEPGVRAVLLHGMAGIGKTTLGQAVCARLPFTDLCVAQVEIGPNPSSETICSGQMKILERLSMSRRRIYDSGDGRRTLEQCLQKCTSPILLFIDNVSDQRYLEELFPTNLVLPHGSRMLMTSRNRNLATSAVLKDIGCEIYSVQELEPSQAREVLYKYLGKTSSDRKLAVDSILKMCGGLPLSLRLIGAYLRYKNNDRAWDSVIDFLEKSIPTTGAEEDRLDKSLRFIYNQLERRTQEALLDISYLLRNVDWDWVESSGYKTELELLGDLSMIKKKTQSISRGELNDLLFEYKFAFAVQRSRADIKVYGSRSTVQIHDLFLALAESEQLSQSSSGCVTRIWSKGEDSLPSPLQEDDEDLCRGVGGLVIRNSSIRNCSSPIPSEKLDAMHKSLRILILEGVTVQGICMQDPPHLQICSTPDGFPYKQLPSSKELQVLEIGNHIEFDFEHVQLPRGLQILKLSDLQSLKSLPHAFGELINLHSLQILRCPALEELPVSFCDLKGLRRLFLVGNKALKSLPKDFHRLQSLQILHLSYCTNLELEEFSSGFSNLVELQELHLEGCNHFTSVPNDLGHVHLTHLKDLALSCEGIETLPDDFHLLKSLRYLSLTECKLLKELPRGFGNLVALSELDLEGCEALQQLPNDFSELMSLKKFSLLGCKLLKGLPSEFGNLVALSELELRGCESLQQLPNGFSQLRSLTSLSLTECGSLQELPSDFSQLRSLTRLSMWGCKLLKELPSAFGKLVALSDLKLVECESLQQLPNDFSQLKSLTGLALRGCKLLKELPSGFGNLVALSELDLRGCESLQELPHDFSQLKSLTWLTLWGCKLLKEFPSGFGNLVALSNLEVYECDSLQKLPDDFSLLKSLTCFSMHECKLVQELPTGFGTLGLSYVVIISCESLQKLPDDFSQLTLLNEFKVRDCQLFRELPSGFGNLTALNEMEFEDCESLEQLPIDFSHLKSLTWLNFSGCKLLRELPSGFGNLEELVVLDLDGCENLQQLPDNFSQLKSLESLSLQGCKSLRELPSGFGDLVKLETLSLRECKSLKELPSGFGNLGALSQLELDGCESLQRLPDDFSQLKSLKDFTFEDCKLLQDLPSGFGNLDSPSS